MTEHADESHLPPFPTDLSAKNCRQASVPTDRIIEIEGVLSPLFLSHTTLETNQLVARCEMPAGIDEDIVSRFAVIAINRTTGETLPVPLTQAVSGELEVRPPQGDMELRFLIERPDDFAVAAQHNGVPLVVIQDTQNPSSYTEMLSTSKDEHPVDPEIISVAGQSLGMVNTSSMVELNGKFYYALGFAEGRRDAI